MVDYEADVSDIDSLRRLVIREILYPLSSGAVRRVLPVNTILEFEPQLIWLVDSGDVTLERGGRAILSLKPEDILGPWLSSGAALSLVTADHLPCELVGFSWDVIEQSLADDQDKLNLWCQFQASLAAWFFASFAELKICSAPPLPKYRHYSRGETIILEGDIGEEVFILTNGAASVQVRGSTVGQINKDEVFGALGALTNRGKRTATVVATEPSDCMVFARDEFRDLLRANPKLMEKLFVDMARALNDANDSMLKASSTKWRHLF